MPQLDRNRALLVLQYSLDNHIGSSNQSFAEFVEFFRLHNRIGDSGLVLDAQKYESVGRAGALAADDESGDLHDLIWTRAMQIGRGANAAHSIAIQFHRMRADGDAGSVKIGTNALRRGHGSQGSALGLFFGFHSGREQWPRRTDRALGFPQRLSSMRRQSIQRADFGEHPQL